MSDLDLDAIERKNDPVTGFHSADKAALIAEVRALRERVARQTTKIQNAWDEEIRLRERVATLEGELSGNPEQLTDDDRSRRVALLEEAMRAHKDCRICRALLDVSHDQEGTDHE